MASSRLGAGLKIVRTADRIGNLIAELGVAETNAVSEAAGVEVESKSVDRGVIVVGKGLKGVGNDGQDTAILIEGKTVEEFEAAVDLPIQAADAFGLAEGRIETPGQRLETDRWATPGSAGPAWYAPRSRRRTVCHE